MIFSSKFLGKKVSGEHILYRSNLFFLESILSAILIRSSSEIFECLDKVFLAEMFLESIFPEEMV
jgi:hypothetical protein